MPTAAVSVVIPAQNAGAWIAETISSVAAQSAQARIESVCVVDDGSADDTASIAAGALARAGLGHSIVRANGLGPSAARNLGWQRGRAPWVQFLDADDLLMPTKIERQLDAATGLAEDVAVVYSPWSDLLSAGGDWKPAGWLRDPRIGTDTVADQLENDNFIATGSQLFRRTWLERVGGFDERLRLIEDVDLLLRLAIAGAQFVRVPSAQPLFLYRRHPQSASWRDAPAWTKANLRNLQLVEEHWRQHEALTSERARWLACKRFDTGRALVEGDRRDFDAHVDHLYALWPGFVPPAPKLLRWLTRAIGYRRAERVAVHYRRLKGARATAH
ncbi:MAG TPA: glycosyltransferase family A protein [Vicinamibacterales bacterium]|nr:glycosyltransferase family A protein [Vicinamibacterales bacterium]